MARRPGQEPPCPTRHAAALVEDHGQTARMSQCTEIGYARLVRESDDAIVAAVYEQEGRRLLAHGALVILQVRTVRSPDLDQSGPRWQPSPRVCGIRPPTSTSLAARDDHLAVARQGRQCQQHSRSIVVDHQRSLSARQMLQRSGHMCVTRAALAVSQVVLQIVVALCHGLDGCSRRPAQRRPGPGWCAGSRRSR